jgi:formate-dependent nitrite reductase membrane component NrfD
MPLLRSPDWPLIIELYFFLVGLSAGAFIAAGVADLFGGRRDRAVTKVGAYLALVAFLPGPLFLTIDLGRPSRFLHMIWSPLAQTTIGDGSITFLGFHFKFHSPMSVGSWMLLVYGACVALTCLAVYLEDATGRDHAGLRHIAGAFGACAAFFIAAYPGQLLAATARPFWADARPLGALFLAVGASTGMAALALILKAMGGDAARSLGRLRKAYTIALVVQVVTLVAVLATVLSGPAWSAAAAQYLLSGRYAVLFWLGAVVIGIVVPFVLEVRDGFFGGYRKGPGMVAVSAVLLLVGGFIIKYVIGLAGQAT